MRKLIIFVLFFFLCLFVFAEGVPETQQQEEPEVTEEFAPQPEDYTSIKDLLRINGAVWMTWSPVQRLTFIAGMMAAQGAVFLAVQNVDLIDITEEEKEKLLEWIAFPEPLEFAVRRIDEYYNRTRDLDAAIWSVFYGVYGKSWWATKKENKGRSLQGLMNLTEKKKQVILR